MNKEDTPIDKKQEIDSFRAHWNVVYKPYTDDLEDRFVSNHIKVFEKVLEQFKGKKDLKVLEIACGSGRFSKYLMDNHADIVSEYVITDISDEMIKLTEERMSDHLKGGKVKALRVDAKDLDQHKFEKFDLILGFLVIHLVSDRPAVLKSLKNLLKPESKMVFVVPSDYEKSSFFNGPSKIVEEYLGIKTSNESPFFKMGNVELMKQELEATGLELEEVTSDLVQFHNDAERNFEVFHQLYSLKPEFKTLSKERLEEFLTKAKEFFEEAHKSGEILEKGVRNYVIKLKK